MRRTATTSVLMNGLLIEEFLIERGLRQGDTLSPSLFLLEAEGFKVLMNTLVNANLYRGYSVGWQGDAQLSNLQLMNNTLMV